MRHTHFNRLSKSLKYDIAASNQLLENNQFTKLVTNQTVKQPTHQIGRAIAQAVSRRFPTTAARVETWVWSCGIL
jgi:hypothetical protein